MKHLAVLVSANLVLVQKSGRTRWNHLNPVPIEKVCQRWVDGHVKRLSKSMTRTVLRISDSLYGRVSDGLVNSLTTGWQMLFNDGLKPFVEASR